MTTMIDDPRDAAIGYRLFDRLEATNADLHATQLRLATLKAEIKAIERAIEEETADLRLDIASESLPGGKPRYTNAEQRESALTLALHTSQRTTGLRRELERAQTAYAEAQVAFDDANRSRQDTHLFMQWLTAYLRNTAIEVEG